MDEINERHENNFMLLVLFNLIAAAMIGLIYQTAEHNLTYGNIQWIAGIGLAFMLVFVLKEIFYIFFTSMKSFATFINRYIRKNKNSEVEKLKKRIDEQDVEITNKSFEISSLQDEKNKLQKKIDNFSKNNDKKTNFNRDLDKF